MAIRIVDGSTVNHLPAELSPPALARAGEYVQPRWWPLPSCREAVLLRSVLVRQELSLIQRWRLRIHLLVCSWCRRYGRQIELLRQTSPEQLEDSPVRALSQGARERLRARLREAGDRREDLR